MRTIIFFIFCLLQLQLLSQRINNLISYRRSGMESYFRFSYDNDYFTATDIYYTQGINAELVIPALRKNPLNVLLFKSKIMPANYGIALDHFGFTPTSIRSNAILYGDRPYASCLSIKSFSSVTDTANTFIYSSSVSFGIIGPWAGGEWMQREIHRVTQNAEPLGWQHQISRDLILNYEASFEKQFYHVRSVVAFNGSSSLTLGTLNDKLTAGANLRFGKLESIFSSHHASRFRLYALAEGLVNAIGYDATLQGGLLNSRSPYTIDSDRIKRITFQENVGVVLHIKNLYLEYFQSFLTAEFDGGRRHRWGGIKIGLKV